MVKILLTNLVYRNNIYLMNNRKEFDKSYALLLLVKILKAEGLEKQILVKMMVDELDKIK